MEKLKIELKKDNIMCKFSSLNKSFTKLNKGAKASVKRLVQWMVI